MSVKDLSPRRKGVRTCCCLFPACCHGNRSLLWLAVEAPNRLKVGPGLVSEPVQLICGRRLLKPSTWQERTAWCLHWPVWQSAEAQRSKQTTFHFVTRKMDHVLYNVFLPLDVFISVLLRQSLFEQTWEYLRTNDAHCGGFFGSFFLLVSPVFLWYVDLFLVHELWLYRL